MSRDVWCLEHGSTTSSLRNCDLAPLTTWPLISSQHCVGEDGFKSSICQFSVDLLGIP
jgi:hypothetical protein